MTKNDRLKGKQFSNTKLLHKLITVLAVTLLGICGMHGLAGNAKQSANEKKYDWVIFDYGGTLHRKRDNPKGDRKAMQIIYGEIMRNWFKSRGYKVKYSAMELQKFTEQANKELKARKDVKRPNQKSLFDNIQYYNKWMGSIYRQAGINGYIPLTLY